MKIAVLSDFHFGYAYNTELEEDSFENADAAVGKALEAKADLIVVAGDIFDSRFPRTPMWSRAIRILVRPVLAESSGVKLVSCSKKIKKISKHTLDHVPVVALHGNHESRGKSTNTLEALENAGLLVHLHNETAVFEKDGIRVAFHGMSWVPDRYAKKALDEWNPQPMPGCINVLMLHQSISPFLYSPLEKPSIDALNLPKGFDLIIDGHLHNSGTENVGGTPLIFPGSSVITQFDRAEAAGQKGFYEIDVSLDGTGTGGKRISFKFKPIEGSRKFFFEDVRIDGDLRGSVEKRLDGILINGVTFAKKPLIKLKIIGKENEYAEQDIREIERKYGERAMLRFVKELESPEIAEKVEFLRNLREQKLSAEEIGLNLLHKNLGELKFESTFDIDNVFSLLVEGRVDETLDILTSEQKASEKFE